MMNYKSSILKTLLFMALLAVGLSLLFNFLCIVRVIPYSDGVYFAVLFFETLIFMFMSGVKMRRERSELIREARHEAKEKEEETSDAKNDYKTKEYYITNLTASAIFMLIVYIVRIFMGPLAFSLTFGITSFANFSGLGRNTYLSIGIFFAILILTVFIAQAGVVSGREKRSQDRRYYHEQRMEEAQKESERIRANNAGDVDVLGAVTKYEHHRHHKHTE